MPKVPLGVLTERGFVSTPLAVTAQENRCKLPLCGGAVDF